MSEINVVPYIDVMLVLLVIFMVAAPLVAQGVLIDLPRAANQPLEDITDEPLVVTVRKDGALYLNVGKPTEEGDIGERVSLPKLEETVSRVVAVRPDVPVFVGADGQIDYESVIRIMTRLQNAGVRSIGLLTDPPES